MTVINELNLSIYDKLTVLPLTTYYIIYFSIIISSIIQFQFVAEIN